MSKTISQENWEKILKDIEEQDIRLGRTLSIFALKDIRKGILLLEGRNVHNEIGYILSKQELLKESINTYEDTKIEIAIWDSIRHRIDDVLKKHKYLISFKLEELEPKHCEEYYVDISPLDIYDNVVYGNMTNIYKECVKNYINLLTWISDQDEYYDNIVIALAMANAFIENYYISFDILEKLKNNKLKKSGYKQINHILYNNYFEHADDLMYDVDIKSGLEKGYEYGFTECAYIIYHLQANAKRAKFIDSIKWLIKYVEDTLKKRSELSEPIKEESLYKLANHYYTSYGVIKCYEKAYLYYVLARTLTSPNEKNKYVQYEADYEYLKTVLGEKTEDIVKKAEAMYNSYTGDSKKDIDILEDKKELPNIKDISKLKITVFPMAKENDNMYLIEYVNFKQKYKIRLFKCPNKIREMLMAIDVYQRANLSDKLKCEFYRVWGKSKGTNFNNLNSELYRLFPSLKSNNQVPTTYKVNQDTKKKELKVNFILKVIYPKENI